MLTLIAYLSDPNLVWLGMKMLDDDKTPIAEFKNLKVVFETKDGTVTGVEDVSFSIYPGETVCVVGESGSGKSVSSLSMMRLVEFGGGKIEGGKLNFALSNNLGQVLTGTLGTAIPAVAGPPDVSSDCAEGAELCLR